MKLGYAVTFHFSAHRSDDLKDLASKSIQSFYDNCKYNFLAYISDNQSIPKESFKDVLNILPDNMKYTYIDDQYEKGLTGAWNLGIKHAIAAGCDYVILAGEDIIFDETINNLIEYAIMDEHSDNTVYVPVAYGIRHPDHQIASGPTGKIYQVHCRGWGSHVSPAVIIFSKEFFISHCDEQNDLFSKNNKYNGGDGKWGGQEGSFMEWAENGTRFTVVGTSWIQHKSISSETAQGSWRAARRVDRNRNIYSK
jgi:hypothetical protein